MFLHSMQCISIPLAGFWSHLLSSLSMTAVSLLGFCLGKCSWCKPKFSSKSWATIERGSNAGGLTPLTPIVEVISNSLYGFACHQWSETAFNLCLGPLGVISIRRIFAVIRSHLGCIIRHLRVDKGLFQYCLFLVCQWNFDTLGFDNFFPVLILQS